MQKPLQSPQRFRQFLRWRRHVSGRGQGAAPRSDPILAAASLARCKPVASHPQQQLRMDLLDQAHRNRQCFKPLQAMVHRQSSGCPLSGWRAPPPCART
jgi:hypothetical protein